MIQIMNQQKYSDINKINNMLEDLINKLQDCGFEVININNIGDYEITKNINHPNQRELFAYARVNKIAKDIKQYIINKKRIIHFIEDLIYIATSIERNEINYPEKIKEFKENINVIKNIFEEYFNSEIETLNSFECPKCPKSIDEMDADELREYIKKHNIK